MSVLALRHPIDAEPTYTMRVPAATGWLTANDRGHWTKHAGLIAQWRQHAGWAARRAKLPKLDRVYILAELRFRDRRRRDPANWYPTVKASVDGLCDVGVLPGDWSHHVIGPDLRLGPIAHIGIGVLLLHLWPVTTDG